MRGWKTGSAWLVPALGALLFISGCSYGYSRPATLEADYGRSVTNNMVQMVVNPQAGQEASPAVGLDPKAGVNLQEKYDKSFKREEAAAPSISITTGGGGGGGGGGAAK